jgi:hypothetical protein
MIESIGWEAWTRTRIARVRVWSPTNWTTSQHYDSTLLASVLLPPSEGEQGEADMELS